MTWTAFFIIVFCIVTEILRELAFKLGVMADEANPQSKPMILMVLTSPWLMAGIFFWAVEIVAWIVVLQDTPLHIAFPIMSLIYVGLPVASRWVLNERMTGRHWGGALLICAGVAVIGFFGAGA